MMRMRPTARWRQPGLMKTAVMGRTGVALAVEFDVAFAFEDEIDLGRFLVIVDAGFGADVDNVEGGDLVVGSGEGAAGGAARAEDGVELVDLLDLVVRHGGDGTSFA